ncbi:MAG: alpha/beta hydrolase [Lautropia sp.]|nr:alpha/beta hydrolase [Lautropia sp.]
MTAQTAMTSVTIATEDLWVDTPRGRLFARRWVPARPASPVPIVLFHESLGCVGAWRDFPAALAETTGRSVLAYDRLGFGQSDPYEGLLKPRGFMVEEASEHFDRLKQALGIQRFVAFGHSVGGAIAFCVAAHHPESCLGVISESAVVFVEPKTAVGLVEARRLFADAAQFQRLIKYHGDKSRWVLDAWLDTWMSEEMKTWSLDEVLQQVHCPTLVLQGGSDEFSTDDQPRHIAEHLSGQSSIVMLPKCGHVPHRERLAEVLEACSHWLRFQEIP